MNSEPSKLWQPPGILRYRRSDRNLGEPVERPGAAAVRQVPASLLVVSGILIGRGPLTSEGLIQWKGIGRSDLAAQHLLALGDPFT